MYNYYSNLKQQKEEDELKNNDEKNKTIKDKRQSK